ncbi:MAG: transglutaminase-like domain-containing protein [Akkermansiaceae bacterium]
MSLPPPDLKELSALLRLLDDETPEVRAVVRGKIENFGGDISEVLPNVAESLSGLDRKILSEILSPVRRRILREEWLTPAFGSAAFEGDWELFESQLRLLSDFLHDGVSIRQPLSDALDLLAEEFTANASPVASEDELRVFLFEEGRLKPNHGDYYDPRNSDLAWCIAEGVSNPIGLGLIFMLIGKRLDMRIEGVSFPGHFLCRIFDEDEALVVDCFDRGKVHSQKILLDSSNELTDEQREYLSRASDLGTILLRVLNNLVQSLSRANRVDDSTLLAEIRDSMAVEQIK